MALDSSAHISERGDLPVIMPPASCYSLAILDAHADDVIS